MSFISLCSAEIRFVASLTSSSPKPFRLWEEKSWLQPFTDDWQLLQLSQAGLTQKHVKPTPRWSAHSCSPGSIMLNSSCTKMWWSSHPDLSTKDSPELCRLCWCAHYSCFHWVLVFLFPLRSWYSCFHWGRHLSHSPPQLHLRIMKLQLQSAWWSRSFQPQLPALWGNRSLTMQERVCVCQQSVFSAWQLSAKNFKGNQEMKFWIRIASVC